MKNVLFVCVENSCRSQMAEAFGNMYGIDIIKPYSSGSRPAGAVNTKAIESMQEVGYDMSVHFPKGLQDVPDLEYDLVVTMGCGNDCPVIRATESREWDIPDPKHMDRVAFAEVRDLIADKVKTLIEKINTTSS